MDLKGKHARHPLIGLVDETIRLNSRLRSVFAEVRSESALNDSEHMVLNAVVEAAAPPTVAQIGRSMGQARQLVQRAANSLRDGGLITMVDNPAHKRAPLLVPTDTGLALKRDMDGRAAVIAANLFAEGDEDAARQDIAAGTAILRAIRKQLEARLRER